MIKLPTEQILIYQVNETTSGNVLTNIAKMVYTEWPLAYQSENEFSCQQELEICQRSVQKIPQCFYALLNNEEVIGVAYLLNQDTEFFMQETPWLANVYVAPRFRRRGLGKKLVFVIVNYAKSLGFKNIYLHTQNKCTWYLSLGFEFFCHIETQGNKVDMMKMNLT
jgi:N-acetylglutamate synthase-like GNAT family acetyltransferase